MTPKPFRRRIDAPELTPAQWQQQRAARLSRQSWWHAHRFQHKALPGAPMIVNSQLYPDADAAAQATGICKRTLQMRAQGIQMQHRLPNGKLRAFTARYEN